jgi:rod shape determining protein RodA
MLFSIAGGSWEPWADKHLLRFGIYFIMMIVLAMVDLRVWFAMAYPIYGIGLCCWWPWPWSATCRWAPSAGCSWGPLRFQPSEVMKIGIVLALARYLSRPVGRQRPVSWWLLIPRLMIGMPVLLVAHQPDLGTAMLIALTGLAVMVLAGLSCGCHRRRRPSPCWPPCRRS